MFARCHRVVAEHTLLSHAGAETAAPTSYDSVGFPRASHTWRLLLPGRQDLSATTQHDLSSLSSLPKNYCANDPSTLEDTGSRAESSQCNIKPRPAAQRVLGTVMGGILSQIIIRIPNIETLHSTI